MKARRQEDLVKAVGQFIPEYANESERGCALLVAGIAEGHLEAILKAKLVEVSTTQDKMFELDFAAKIDLAYRLGLISDILRKNLNIVRQIRNEFAHNIFDCNFQNNSVIEHLSRLKASIIGFDEMYAAVAESGERNAAASLLFSGSKEKSEFLFCALVLMIALDQAKRSIGEQIKPAEKEGTFKQNEGQT